MKYAHVYALLLMFVFHTSCGQNHTNVPQDNIKPSRANYSESQFKEADTSKVPMSMVRNVKLARNGDILIASYLGVFRYNGTSFTNLTSKIISPRFSSFWDVLEDRKGNLWFASKDSGVYYYNGKSFQHFTTKDGLASNMALHIYEDRAGNIWFGASRYDGKSFRTFTTKDGFPSNRIRLLLEDKAGKLWFGAQGENMFVYDGKVFTVLKNKDGKAFNNVWAIIEDRNGNIWFGATIIEDKRGDTLFTSNGLWRYDGKTFTKVSQRGAYGIIEDKKGNIWTTGEGALSRYDAKSLYDKMPTVTEIKSGGRMAFLGILEANDGSIWFGAFDGVHRYDGKTFTDFKGKEVLTSCGQNKPDLPKDDIKSKTKDTYHTKYEYTDSIGKRLIIQNSFPRGETYLDPNGNEYFKSIFWTRIINETESPLELTIDFSGDSYELPSSVGSSVDSYRKILLPSDTMTHDKEGLFNYGLTGLDSFLGNSINKPSSLKRTINPKESSGFYVVMLLIRPKSGWQSIKGNGNAYTRAGFSLKGQNLFYTVNGKEIYCGKVNLKNFMLRK